MRENERGDYEELVNIRTHLTVVLLAVSHLHRTYADFPEISRLCMYALQAMAEIRKEVAKIDALLALLEDREAIRADPIRFRLSPVPRQNEAGHHPNR